MRYLLTGLIFLLLFSAGCKSKDKDVIPAPVPTSPITAEVSTPASPQTGEITIDYNLIDDRAVPVNADIKVYYSANGGGFTEATQGTGGDGTTNLTTAATPGAAHTFVWDSAADLGTGVYSVVVKIEPYETGTTELGYAGQSGTFQVVIAEPSAAPQAKVFDPKLPGCTPVDLSYRVEPSGIDFSVTVSVVNGASVEVRRLVDAQTRAGGTDFTVAWDGRNDSAKFVDTGEYRVRVEAVYSTLPAWTAEEALYVVRLGVAGVQFVGNGAGEEYQIMYHIRNTTVGNRWAVPDNEPQWAIGPDSGDVADLDTDDGLPRSLPLAWTGPGKLDSPPQDPTDTGGVEDDNYNLPVCYRRAALPKFTMTLGSGSASNVTPNTARGCGYPVSGLPLRIVSGLATPETAGGNEAISPGGSVSFICNGALPDAIKKNTLNLTFTFEYQDGGAWHQISGAVSTAHTVYTIYDKPMLTASATPVPPYLAWVSVLDIVCGWVDGPASADTICSIVTNRVNTFFGLQYDTTIGQDEYIRGTMESHTLEMSYFIQDFRSSAFGYVNCSDCACLTATFANTVGIDHKYVILADPYSGANRIPLNYMIPIGRSWTVPFGGYFNYHAVSSRDDGATISDACCTLDNDGTPTSPPHTPILPVNLPYGTYNVLLSWDPGSYGIYGIWRCGQY